MPATSPTADGAGRPGVVRLDAVRALSARERDRERKRKARAAAKTNEDGEKRAPSSSASVRPSGASGGAVQAPATVLDDAAVARSLAGALALVWKVLGLLAGTFGRALDPYTDEEAAEVSRALVPLARRLGLGDGRAGWLAGPLALAMLVARKLRKREPQKAPAPPAPAVERAA